MVWECEQMVIRMKKRVPFQISNPEGIPSLSPVLAVKRPTLGKTQLKSVNPEGIQSEPAAVLWKPFIASQPSREPFQRFNISTIQRSIL
jgi:hypothetical protein